MAHLCGFGFSIGRPCGIWFCCIPCLSWDLHVGGGERWEVGGER